jgi:GGDEF domain-containing protein
LAYQHVIDFLFNSTGITHHGGGDILPRETAQNFTSCMYRLRLGGDEFVLMLFGLDEDKLKTRFEIRFGFMRFNGDF